MNIVLIGWNLLQKCSVAHLVDHYLGKLYPDYESHTRTVLVRQARDLLLCTFHGDLRRFEVEFLEPAADILKQVKNNHQQQWINLYGTSVGSVSEIMDRRKLVSNVVASLMYMNLLKYINTIFKCQRVQRE